MLHYEVLASSKLYIQALISVVTNIFLQVNIERKWSTCSMPLDNSVKADTWPITNIYGYWTSKKNLLRVRARPLSKASRC